jgi:hypothetical protein
MALGGLLSKDEQSKYSKEISPKIFYI